MKWVKAKAEQLWAHLPPNADARKLEQALKRLCDDMLKKQATPADVALLHHLRRKISTSLEARVRSVQTLLEVGDRAALRAAVDEMVSHRSDKAGRRDETEAWNLLARVVHSSCPRPDWHV